jgi:hypothetical protein
MKMYLPICFAWFYFSLVLNKTTVASSLWYPFQNMSDPQSAQQPVRMPCDRPHATKGLPFQLVMAL